MKALLLLLIFLTVSGIATAQLPVPGMRIYDSSDGYPANTGYVISQDSTGFIWIGTDQGAVYFDGHQFETLDESDGLTDKEILMIIPASNRQVVLSPLLNNWACYKDGHLLSSSELNLKQVKNQRMNVCVAGEKDIWLGDDMGSTSLYRLNLDGLCELAHTIDKPFILKQVFDDSLFIFLDIGAIIPAFYNTTRKELHLLTEIGRFPGISKMVVDNKKQMILTHSPEENLLRLFQIFNNNKLGLKHSYKLERKVKQVIVDRNNRLWITFIDEGLQFWGNINEFTSASKPIDLFPNSIINHVFVDRDDNIWLTTEGQGLFFISANHWANYLLNRKLGLPQSKLPRTVTLSHGSQIVIGYALDNTIGKIERGRYRESSLATSKSAPVSGMYSIGDELYINNAEKSFEINYSGDNVKVVNSISLPNALKDLCAGPAGSDVLYAATHAGVIELHSRDARSTGLVYPDRSTSVSLVRDSILLIGTPYGLYKRSSGNKNVPVEYASLQKAHISALLEVSNDHTIIGTTTQGLFLYEHDKNSFRSLAFEGRNIQTVIKKIVRDGDSCFWVGSDQGIYRVEHDGNFKELSYKHYNYLDGLPSNNVLDLTIYRDTVYAVCSAGLVILPFRHPYLRNKPSKVNIYKLMAGDKTLYSPDHLSLNHNQNDLELSLKSFSYDKIEPVQYRYKLEGYHKRWYNTPMPQMTLNALPPGNYTLALATKDGSSSSYTYLPVIIHPAFWQKTWFLVITIAVSIIILILLIRFIMVQYKTKALRKLENKKRLAQLELEAIKAQINPHFIYNCLNSIQYFTQLGQPDKADRYISTFAALLRQTMQHSQETFISIGKEISYLENYLQMEKMRFKNKLNYRIDAPVQLHHVEVPAMMLQPFIENAIKHGIVPLSEKGELRIVFKQREDGHINILIEDNGPGWDQESPSDPSLGLRLAGSRAYTYNQLFEMGININIHHKSIAENGETGTIIELFIPVKHESYSYNY